jgi:hypothetical protein
MTNKDGYLMKTFGALIGRTVTGIQELSDSDMEELGWYRTMDPAFMFTFDDGSVLIPSADPEGNGAGFAFLFSNNEEEE